MLHACFVHALLHYQHAPYPASLILSRDAREVCFIIDNKLKSSLSCVSVLSQSIMSFPCTTKNCQALLNILKAHSSMISRSLRLLIRDLVNIWARYIMHYSFRDVGFSLSLFVHKAYSSVRLRVDLSLATFVHEWDGVQVPPVLASGESAGDFTLIGQTFVGSRIAAEKRSFTVTGSMNNLDIEQECVNSFPSHKSFFFSCFQ